MRRQLTYVFILVGAVLAILSGCQKEEVAPTSNALTSIGRLDAERLLAAWNIQQKGRLKSATALTVTEGMWQKSKVSVFAGEQSSFISVPFTARITLVFADRGGCQKLFFLEARPSTSEPAAISASSFTGYVVVYDSQLAPIVALRYELGRFASYHDVRKRTSYNKSAEDGGIALTGEIAEVVITPKPKPTQPPASPTGEPDPVRPVEVISWIERDEFGGGDPGLDLLSDSQLDQLSPHERANAQLAWMDTHGGKDAVTAILRVAYAAGLTESDKAKIYQAIDAAYKSLKGQYIMAVFRPVAETLKPVLELVLLENISEGLVKGILEAVKVVVTTAGGADLFNFGKMAAEHMLNPDRRVSILILDDVVKNTKGLVDPKGSTALMHYSQMWKNGKLYNLEVLYDKASNSIWHFKYTQDAIGPLPAIQ